MTRTSIRDYIRTLRPRYALASRTLKRQILTEFCATTGYHRKAAIRALQTRSLVRRPRRRRGRPPTYSPLLRTTLTAIWAAAGYPWSARLKALLPLWLPWVQHHFPHSPEVTQQLERVSPRTIDRLLQNTKTHHKRRLYGRTKPGTLLKHHIPIKTERWDVTAPGFAEIDLVAHSGPSADGEFLQSLNFTDIHSTWVETRAVLGKSQRAIQQALDDIATALPFSLHGVDSDNGSEFINHHLFRYCQRRAIQFTRGRPYKKDDNAHIEQKNWTHVRRLLGWDRYDSPDALAALNDLYRNELRLMMNLFQPTVKLLRKVRVGSRLRRRYDRPQTPLDRLLASDGVDRAKLQALQQLRAQVDPFTLAAVIDRKLRRIGHLATRGHIPGRPHPQEYQRFEIHHLPTRSPVTPAGSLVTPFMAR